MSAQTDTPQVRARQQPDPTTDSGPPGMSSLEAAACKTEPHVTATRVKALGPGGEATRRRVRCAGAHMGAHVWACTCTRERGQTRPLSLPLSASHHGAHGHCAPLSTAVPGPTCRRQFLPTENARFKTLSQILIPSRMRDFYDPGTPGTSNTSLGILVKSRSYSLG